MNSLQFWSMVGTDKVRAVCADAGTSYAYFKHIAHGRKRPSYELAKKLSSASSRITGHTLDILLLLEAKRTKPEAG